MSDLIERDKVAELFKELFEQGVLTLIGNDYLQRKLNAIPSARPKGEWMPIIEANEFGETYQAGIYCSECGETLGCEANFCPNCGADMRPKGE